jgi:CRP-like cAMP-binding protein
MADQRRKSGLGGVSGMFGLLTGRRSSASEERRPSSSARPRIHDPMERLPRPPRDIARLMADIEAFGELNTRDREVLADISHIARCHGGTAVWTAGDPAMWMMVIVEGRIEMRARIGPGVEHMVRSHVKGDIVGVEAGLGAETYHLNAFASERTAVLRVSCADLRQVIGVGKPAAVKLFASLSVALGDQLRAATLEVVDLLERSSIMPSRGDTVGEDDLSKLINQP